MNRNNIISSFPIKLSLSLFLILFSININSSALLAQACCASGSPSINNMLNYSLINDGLSVQLTYDHILLNDIVSGSKNLDDHSRKRTTRAFIMQASYNFSGNWGISALLPYVWKNEVNRTNGSVSSVSSDALGDVGFMAFYQNSLSLFEFIYLGTGIRTSSGYIDHKDELGIHLAPDMQSGNGTTDWLWAASYSGSLNPFYNFNTSISGQVPLNNAYFGNLGPYNFGSELQLQSGFSRVFYFDKTFLNGFLFLRYRYAQQHNHSGFGIPNTGGHWIALVPRLDMVLWDQLRLIGRMEIPLLNYLNGTQLTSTFGFRLGFEYLFT